MPTLWKGSMEFAWDTVEGEDWTPTIGIVGPDGGDLAGAQVVTEAVGRAILQISSNQVILGDIRTGTWAPDSTPYNPNASIPKAINANGARITNGNPVDLETVWKLAKDVGGGLPGGLNLRGVLGEGDVDALDSGRWRFIPNSAPAPGGELVGYLNLALAAFFSNGNWPYKLAVISRPLIGRTAAGVKIWGPIFARLVRQLKVDKVGSLNLTKRRKPQGGSRVPIMAGIPYVDPLVTVLNEGPTPIAQTGPDVPTYEEYLLAQS